MKSVPVILACSALAYRDKGHLIAARIAEKQLTQKAATAIQRSISVDDGAMDRDEQQFTAYGVWMDYLKKQGGRWMDDWHFDDGQFTYHEDCKVSGSDPSKGETTYVPCTRCTEDGVTECKTNPRDCLPCKTNTGNPSFLKHPDNVSKKVAQTLDLFTRDQDPALSVYNMAYKFFIHLLVDLHQPNHTGSMFSNFGLEQDCSQGTVGAKVSGLPQQCLSCGVEGELPTDITCPKAAAHFPNLWCVGESPRDSKGDIGSNLFYIQTPEGYKPSGGASVMKFHLYFDYGAEIWSGRERVWANKKNCEALGKDADVAVEAWTMLDMVSDIGQEYVDCWADELLESHKDVADPEGELTPATLDTWYNDTNGTLRSLHNTFFNPPAEDEADRIQKVKELLKGADCPTVGADLTMVPGALNGEVGMWRDDATAMLERLLVSGGKRLGFVLNETFGKADVPEKDHRNGTKRLLTALAAIPLALLL